MYRNAKLGIVLGAKQFVGTGDHPDGSISNASGNWRVILRDHCHQLLELQSTMAVSIGIHHNKDSGTV